MNQNTLVTFCAIFLLASCSKKDDTSDIPDEVNVRPSVGLHIEKQDGDDAYYVRRTVYFTAYLLDSNENDRLYTSWDFDGDSEWDIQAHSEKNFGTNTYIAGSTHEYRFEAVDTGKKIVTVQVSDHGGLINVDTAHIYIKQRSGAYNNQAPKFYSLSPMGSGLIPYNIPLEWNFHDPEGNKMTYDVFIYPEGQTEPIKHFEKITEESILVDLEAGKTYNWKVIATDEWEAETSSDTKKFETCTIKHPCPDKPVVYDSDGKAYPTVEICGKCWMAKNLNTLPYQPSSNWSAKKICRSNDSTLCEKEGGYYVQISTETVNGKTQSLCPDGFHVPTSNEWGQVLNQRNYESMITGGKVGLNLEPMGYLERESPISSSPKHYNQRCYYWMSPITGVINTRLKAYGKSFDRHHDLEVDGPIMAPIRCVAN